MGRGVMTRKRSFKNSEAVEIRDTRHAIESRRSKMIELKTGASLGNVKTLLQTHMKSSELVDRTN